MEVESNLSNSLYIKLRRGWNIVQLFLRMKERRKETYVVFDSFPYFIPPSFDFIFFRWNVLIYFWLQWLVALITLGKRNRGYQAQTYEFKRSWWSWNWTSIYRFWNFQQWNRGGHLVTQSTFLTLFTYQWPNNTCKYNLINHCSYLAV